MPLLCSPLFLSVLHLTLPQLLLLGQDTENCVELLRQHASLKPEKALAISLNIKAE